MGGEDADAYAEGVLAGDRRGLARAITLLESRRPDQADLRLRVLERLGPASGGAVRLGVSGPPGVGKSTLIEALGLSLIERGHRVAVLAIDPTSPVSGGSILGDKTRMARLAAEPAAFIRPSPSGGTLGGVAHRTREALLVCEAAGFDVVVIETVGVGQSEAEVASMVDFFALMIQPGAGDELQGIKRGALELADALVVSKADGETRALAERTCGAYRQALGLLRPRSSSWTPPVQPVSARTGEGVGELWERVLEHRKALEASGELEARRRAQQREWLHRLLRDALEAELRAQPGVAELLPELERQVEDRATTPPEAARRLLAAFRDRD